MGWMVGSWLLEKGEGFKGGGSQEDPMDGTYCLNQMCIWSLWRGKHCQQHVPPSPALPFPGQLGGFRQGWALCQ